MAANHENELARELMRRGMSRREMIKTMLRLGLGASSIGAILAACGQAAQPGGQGAAATSAPAAEPTAAPAAEPTAASIFDINEGADANWPKSAVADPGSRVTISVAHAWDATFFERQKQFDQLFMQRHPNIEVKAENTPWGDFRQKYVAQAAGNALPDLLYVHFSWAQEMIREGLFKPVDDYIQKEQDFNLDDFSPPSLVSYRRDGKLWGLPYDEGPGILYYNKDLFDAAGESYPDDSWDLERLKQVAIKLTKGEGPEKIFGLGSLPSPGDGAMAPSYLFPFGAQYLSEPKEDQVLINKPEAVAAMEWWEELRAKGAVPSPADLQNVAWPAFQFGKIAMVLEGSWATPPIQANSKFKWAIAKWPKGPKAHSTFSAGSAYMITRDSKNPDVAWIYLNEYLSTAGQSYMWASTGRGSPARLSAWPAYLESKFAPEGAKNIEDSMRTIASHDILDQPTATRVVQTAQPIWDLVVAGQLDVKSALDQIAQAIEPIVAENRG
ncbi:MAG TPA: sugar ABC transporter substrate-binding protein [Roseiflexaceae bacterium]|nr:sugar ABC transporter substrate-binding protein [Roseiflexaceae bacterium]